MSLWATTKKGYLKFMFLSTRSHFIRLIHVPGLIKIKHICFKTSEMEDEEVLLLQNFYIHLLIAFSSPIHDSSLNERFASAGEKENFLYRCRIRGTYSHVFGWIFVSIS